MVCGRRNVSTDVIHQTGCFPKLLKITRPESFSLSEGSLGAAGTRLPGTLASLLLFVKLGGQTWGGQDAWAHLAVREAVSSLFLCGTHYFLEED